MFQITSAITILILTLSFGPPALAHKNVGGGNGVGGVLLDREAYRYATDLSSQEILRLLKTQHAQVFERFPLIENLSEEVIHFRKSWYLDDAAFVPDCVNQSISELQKDVLACQNDVEVRIRRSWWNSATDLAKADLILHEVFTYLWLEIDEARTIHGVVAALLNPNSNVESVLQKMHLAKLPAFLPAALIDKSMEKLLTHTQRLCHARSLDDAWAYFNSLQTDRHSPNEEWNAMPELLARGGLLSFIATCQFGAKSCNSNQTTKARQTALWDSFKSRYPEAFGGEAALDRKPISCRF